MHGPPLMAYSPAVGRAFTVGPMCEEPLNSVDQQNNTGKQAGRHEQMCELYGDIKHLTVLCPLEKQAVWLVVIALLNSGHIHFTVGSCRKRATNVLKTRDKCSEHHSTLYEGPNAGGSLDPDSVEPFRRSKFICDIIGSC